MVSVLGAVPFYFACFPAGFIFWIVVRFAEAKDYKNMIALWPNQSPEPTAVGAVRSAIAGNVTNTARLSFFR